MGAFTPSTLTRNCPLHDWKRTDPFYGMPGLCGCGHMASQCRLNLSSTGVDSSPKAITRDICTILHRKTSRCGHWTTVASILSKFLPQSGFAAAFGVLATAGGSSDTNIADG